jgi:hypothetical protein
VCMRPPGYSLTSTPSPSFSRVLTLWVRLTEIPCVTVLRLRLAALGSRWSAAPRRVFSGLQTGSRSLSPACRISLSSVEVRC